MQVQGTPEEIPTEGGRSREENGDHRDGHRTTDRENDRSVGGEGDPFLDAADKRELSYRWIPLDAIIPDDPKATSMIKRYWQECP